MFGEEVERDIRLKEGLGSEGVNLGLASGFVQGEEAGARLARLRAIRQK